MKRLLLALVIIALMLGGYAVYRTIQIEAAIQPRVRLITASAAQH